jgi:bacillithiol biosynthesis cysteine-adding enzyme BshC
MKAAPSTRAPQAIASEAEGFHGDYVRGETRALAFLPRHPSRERDWTARIEEVAARPPASDVWRRALEEGERLGAGEAALTNARALAEGDALCVTTGQQPGLFLGPLYVAYKVLTVIELARQLQEETARKTAPVFWNAADDSDFGEVRSAFFPGEDFRLIRHALDGGELPAGGMVGGLGVSGTRRELEALRTDWAALPRGSALIESLERAIARADDHGELTTALLYDLFREAGLVVVDGRWPELRRAAAPLFRRYVDRRTEAEQVVGAAGEALVSTGYRARIAAVSSRNALFRIRRGARVPFEGTEEELLAHIESEPETLSPNVTLRPLVQDSLFPNVATVGGPGEISYHAQLAPEYALLEVPMPVLVPRFEATLIPPGLRELARRRDAPLESFVRDFDRALRDTTGGALPAELAGALDDLEAGLESALERVRQAASGFDAKLDAAVSDAARRIADGVRRLREKAAASARSQEARRDPAVKHYREFLRPRGVPQERVLSTLSLFLEARVDPLRCLGGAVQEHLEGIRAGRPVHWLLDYHGCDEETGP